MNKSSLPSLWDAPSALLGFDGHCGLLTAWVALRHFRRRTSADRLVRACGYVRRRGVFSVALASALHGHGLDVTFYSDPDPAMQPAERRYYARVRRLGILVQPAAPLKVLLAHVAAGRIPIVLYHRPDGEIHFSILTGAAGGRVQFHDDTELTRRCFEHGWNTPDTLRQSVVVGANSQKAATRRLNFEVQHGLVANEALIGCFVFMSFSGSVV